MKKLLVRFCQWRAKVHWHDVQVLDQYSWEHNEAGNPEHEAWAIEKADKAFDRYVRWVNLSDNLLKGL